MCAERSHGNCGPSMVRTKPDHDMCIYNKNNILHHRQYIQIYSPTSRRHVTLPRYVTSTFLPSHPFTNGRLHIVNLISKITPFGSLCSPLKSSLIQSFCIERSIYKYLAWSGFFSYFLLNKNNPNI